MEEPVRGGYAPAFHFHAALTGRRRPTLRGDDGVQVRAPRQKRLWTAPGMGHPLHRAQVPREGVVGVSEQGAGQRPLGGCEPGIPAGLLGLKPAPSPRPLGAPRRGGPMRGTTASPQAARPPPHALPRSGAVPPGLALRASRGAHRRRERRAWPRARMERLAEAGAQARSRAERPPTASRAVHASAQEASDPLRRLLRERRGLDRSRRVGQGRRTGRLGVPPRPAPAAPAERGEGHGLGEPPAVWRRGQARDGQSASPPRPPRPQPLVAHRPHPARERPRRARGEDRARRHPQPPRRRPPRLTGPLRAPLTLAYDAVGEPRAQRFARRTLDTPEGDATQPAPHGMRVACQAPASTTGRRGVQRQATGAEQGEDTRAPRLPSAKEVHRGRCVLHIDGAGPVFTGLAGGVAQGASSGQMVGVVDDPTWGNACPIAREWGRRRGVTTQLGGM